MTEQPARYKVADTFETITKVMGRFALRTKTLADARKHILTGDNPASPHGIVTV
jgi:hypothetical protein